VSLDGLKIKPATLFTGFLFGAFVEPALTKLLLTGELCECRLLLSS
jgi:hypothetical protein